MTTRRRLAGLSLTRLLSLAVAAVAAVGGLVFAYLKFFYAGDLPYSLKPRSVEDGLAVAVLIVLVALYMASRPEAVHTAPPRRRFSWRVTIPLVMLILIASYLRFHAVEAESLDSAELIDVSRLMSGSLAASLMPGPRVLDSWPSIHVPVYLFIKLAGDSEFSLRFLSVLCSILAVPTVFVIGRRMFSDREGLLGAALIIGLAGVIRFAQYARMYGPLTLLAGLSGYFWYRLVEDLYWRRRPRKWLTFFYAATLITMIYMHHYGLMLAGLEGLGALVVMLSTRRISPTLFASFIAAGLAYAPWLPMLYKDLHNTTFQATYRPASLFVMIDEFAQFLPYDTTLGRLLMVLAGAGIGFALWKAFRNPGRVAPPLLLSPAVMLGAWLLVLPLIAYFRSLVATPIVQYRYFLVALPALAVLLGRAITRLPVPRIGQMVVGVGLPVVLTASLFFNAFYTEPHDNQYREVLKYIIDHDQQYPDSVIAGSLQGTATTLSYYFRKYNSPRRLDLKLVPPAVDQSLQRIRDANTRYVWLIGEDYAFDTSLLDKLDQYYTQIDTQRWYFLTLWLYERKDAGQTP